MKPYYEKDGISIYHCSFREAALQRFIRESNVIVADPPYGETSLAWDRWPVGWPAYLADQMAANASLWCFGSARMFLQNASEFHPFRFVEFVGYLKGELLDVDTGESLGTTTPLSKSVLAASRRTS